MFRGTAGVVNCLSSSADGIETHTELHIEAHCLLQRLLVVPVVCDSVFQYGEVTGLGFGHNCGCALK